MLKKGLGKGLSALIPDAPASNDSQALEIEVEKIAPNPFQPRRSFDEAAIAELATSIRENGVIQPLLVRLQNGGYELIAGERRLRAAVRAGLDKVPVVVREASDHEALQFALIENVQREDLNPMEEATAYQRLQEEFGWSQEEVASRVGMSRPAVANSIRLLLLPREVQEDVASGRLAAGQARALLGLQREALILSAARDAIAKGLSTRETERLVQKLKAGPRRARGTSSVDADLRSLIETLQRSLGTKVRIIQRGKSARGRIEIDYYSSIDLDRIVQAMTSHP
jgi:ParB family chromosome partitioning protein